MDSELFGGEAAVADRARADAARLLGRPLRRGVPHGHRVGHRRHGRGARVVPNLHALQYVMGFSRLMDVVAV